MKPSNIKFVKTCNRKIKLNFYYNKRFKDFKL